MEITRNEETTRTTDKIQETVMAYWETIYAFHQQQSTTVRASLKTRVNLRHTIVGMHEISTYYVDPNVPKHNTAEYRECSLVYKKY